MAFAKDRACSQRSPTAPPSLIYSQHSTGKKLKTQELCPTIEDIDSQQPGLIGFLGFDSFDILIVPGKISLVEILTE